MKITGNEDNQKLDDSLTTTAEIDKMAEGNPLTDDLFFGSLMVSVNVNTADFDKGQFDLQLDFDKIKLPPSISIAVDSLELAEDLFKNSKSSASNREGILQFIKAGLLSAVSNSFSATVFNDHLQILDEKLKSKTLEIQQANIEVGDLEKTDDVPNLVTSKEDLEASKVEPIKEIEKELIAQGFEEIEDEDDVPANYKPLSDGTSDGQPLHKEDEGSLEPIGKLNH